MTDNLNPPLAETPTPRVSLGPLDGLAVGTLRSIRVGDRRVCVARTASGVFAVDHGCPHEGYGLTQGALQGDVLTCAWHNWKFDVTTGSCLVGEEDVGTHPVTVDAAGEVTVTLRIRESAHERVRLTESLRRGIAADRPGQIARDVVRLLRAEANPAELVWQAVAHGAPRAEFGWGHSIAVAADALAMVGLYDGDERALPVVQAIAHTAETERDRPVNPLAEPLALPAAPAAAFRAAVEAEDLTVAQGLVRGAIASGTGADELEQWFVGAVSDHFLSYGHGGIYVQKGFQLLDHLGWDRADTVLSYLVPTIVYATREDTLPYMRAFARRLAVVDLPAFTVAAGRNEGNEGHDATDLVVSLLGRVDDVIACALAAVATGATADDLLDAALQVVCTRMLRYDIRGEFDVHDDFRWLDLTHGITFVDAVRHHHRRHPGPDTMRLVLHALWLAHWTGRHEWHTRVGEEVPVAPVADIAAAGDELQRDSLADHMGSAIAHVHGIKTARAAALEAARSGSAAPLAATRRFLDGPRMERFVAAGTARAIELASGRRGGNTEDLGTD